LSMAEYPLYTDSWLTGEAEKGWEPYSIFNMVPLQRLYEGKEYVCASLALRVGIHVDFETPDMSKTEASRYHGGGLVDEIAALASLVCGIRLRPGGQSRYFESGGDPLGKPVAWNTEGEPVLHVRNQGLVLPNASGQHSLNPLVQLKTFPQLTPQKAIVLIRCARLYQDALWLSESEPHLSWLLLVSAVETAAVYWKTSNDSAIDRLKTSYPQLVEFLEKTGIPNLCSTIADTFSESLGSTKKFIDFLLNYLPLPPEKRPGVWGQVKWENKELKNSFRQIYGYRSKALHNGQPFPAPMCHSPRKLQQDWDAVEERPYFSASSVSGGTWVAKDIPMSLHTFEYIARNALIKWWMDSLTTPPNQQLKLTVGALLR